MYRLTLIPATGPTKEYDFDTMSELNEEAEYYETDQWMIRVEDLSWITQLEEAAP
jgi:hypothetical protein